MNNVEKGKLLADLFPDELENIIKKLEENYCFLQEKKEEIFKKWKNDLITAHTWYQLAEFVNNAISKEQKRLLKSRRFADQLFDGYLALYTIDCIVKYAQSEKMDTKFYHLVSALFNLSL